MSEDNEEKRFSRKKSAVKGPFIQDEDSQPKPQKPQKEEKPQENVPENKGDEKGTEPEVPETKPRKSKPVIEPSTKEKEKSSRDSKKEKKKREKEEKKAQADLQRETRKKEKLSKSQKKKGRKKVEEAENAIPETAGTPDMPAKGVPEKPETEEIPAVENEPENIEAPPVAEESEEIPAAGQEDKTEDQTEEPVQAASPASADSSAEEKMKEPSGETPTAGDTELAEDATQEDMPEAVEAKGLEETEQPGVQAQAEPEKREGRRFKKGEPVVSFETPAETSKKESKREKRRMEKEEKRRQSLIEKDKKIKNRETQTKIKGMKKAGGDIKKASESRVSLAKETRNLPAAAAEEEKNEPEDEGDNDERVSRFSLKKFVTAYRDRQSVLVRQAEIKRFQSALFPKVMARKWQTAITPSVELPTKGIELPAVPVHMKLGLFFFRNFYSKRQNNDKLETALRKAKMPYSAIQYYSMITIVAIIAGLAGILAISAFALVTGIFLWYAYPALGGIVGLMALLALNSPQSLVNKRKKDIDSKLPMALAYIATMASADVPVETIMYELGKSYEYGEIAKEAKAISASSRLFGNDIVTALREESKYSPSLKFAEFLQGITSTVTSGGNLKDYFTMKAVQFQSELSTVIRANAESVGVLAESYVTVGVAFPLMLLVILGVMAALSPSGSGGLTLVLYMVVLAIIPAITFGFTFLVSSTVKEVDV